MQIWGPAYRERFLMSDQAGGNGARLICCDHFCRWVGSSPRGVGKVFGTQQKQTQCLIPDQRTVCSSRMGFTREWMTSAWRMKRLNYPVSRMIARLRLLKSFSIFCRVQNRCCLYKQRCVGSVTFLSQEGIKLCYQGQTTSKVPKLIVSTLLSSPLIGLSKIWKEQTMNLCGCWTVRGNSGVCSGKRLAFGLKHKPGECLTTLSRIIRWGKWWQTGYLLILRRYSLPQSGLSK